MYENVYMVIEWLSSIPFSNKKISTLLRSYEYARTYIAETDDIYVRTYDNNIIFLEKRRTVPFLKSPRSERIRICQIFHTGSNECDIM